MGEESGKMVILTDLSDVLVGGMKGTGQQFKKMPWYSKDLVAKCYQVHLSLLDLYYSLLRGEITEDDYWGVFFATEYWPFTIEDAKAALSRSLQMPIPGTLELFKSITQYPIFDDNGVNTGFAEGIPPIYIVSDHVATRINEVKSYHPEVFNLAESEYWSCDLGHTKRERKFFTEVLADLDLAPYQAIFIDDDPINVAVAASVGIPSIPFEGADDLRETLISYGVKFRSE